MDHFFAVRVDHFLSVANRWKPSRLEEVANLGGTRCLASSPRVAPIASPINPSKDIDDVADVVSGRAARAD